MAQSAPGKIYMKIVDSNVGKTTTIFECTVATELEPAFAKIRSFSVKEIPEGTLADTVNIGRRYKNSVVGITGKLLGESSSEFCFQNMSGAGIDGFFNISKTDNLTDWELKA